MSIDQQRHSGLAAMSSAVVDYLGGLGDAERPVGAEPATFRTAVNYAIERYQEGLGHYTNAFAALGVSGAQRGLDIGCGAGHWCLAFLEYGQEVLGIDLRQEYAVLATKIAREFGYAGRARFATARAERLPFAPASFDFCWSHGVLMFADVEDALREVARVLRDGGAFYCAYTLAGTRVLQLTRAVTAGSATMFQRHLTIILEAALRRCGVFQTAGSRVQMLEVAELTVACRAFGLELVGRPGVQDLNIRYLGFDATGDLLVRKGTTTSAGLGLEGLLLSGCPRLVVDILSDRSRLGALEPELRPLYARALILSGRALDRDAMQLLADTHLLRDAALQGIFALDRRKPAEAAGAFEALDAAHPDKDFLLAMCDMRMRRHRSAVARFRRAISADRCALRNWVGLSAALLAAGENSEAVLAYRDFVRSRGEAGATTAEIDTVLGEISVAPPID